MSTTTNNNGYGSNGSTHKNDFEDIAKDIAKEFGLKNEYEAKDAFGDFIRQRMEAKKVEANEKQEKDRQDRDERIAQAVLSAARKEQREARKVAMKTFGAVALLGIGAAAFAAAVAMDNFLTREEKNDQK